MTLLQTLTNSYDGVSLREQVFQAFRTQPKTQPQKAWDERELLDLPKRKVSWSGATSAENAKRVLASGDYRGARHIVAQELKKSPQNEDLKQLARVIAPPRVLSIRSNVSNDSLAANRQWLKNQSESYAGKWVALRDGSLVAAATDLEEVKQQAGNLSGLFITRVF